MTPDIVAASPPPTVYRVGRSPDPWAWPDWRFSLDDDTFGNRYDDPQGRYRVLYACSQRLGAFVEVLARFRPDPTVVAELAVIDGDDDTVPAGTVHRSWLRRRRLGAAHVRGTFADVGHSRSIAALHQALAPVLADYGLDELDAAAIRLAAPRAFTQRVSRYLYDLTTDDGRRRFDGIRYQSRLGDDFTNWAIYEPADLDPLTTLDNGTIPSTDPDLTQALHLHGLTLT